MFTGLVKQPPSFDVRVGFKNVFWSKFKCL